MLEFISLVSVALSFGAAFGLLALSINIIYSTSNILNFAQGEFMMLGGMLGWLFYSTGFVPYLPTVALVAVIAGAIGLLEYYVAVWPLMRRRSTIIAIIISTLGFSIVMRIATALLMGRVQRFAQPPLGDQPVFLLGLPFMPQALLIFVATIVALLGIWWLYAHTTLGLALRAAAVQPDGARVVGINVSGVTAGAFAGAGALAGLAGLLISPLSYASPWLGLDFAIEGFAAAIVGGLGSWRGAVIGGLLLGTTRSIVLTYVSPTWGSFVSLTLILLVLFVRPNGLFGEWQSTTQGTR